MARLPRYRVDSEADILKAPVGSVVILRKIVPHGLRIKMQHEKRTGKFRVIYNGGVPGFPESAQVKIGFYPEDVSLKESLEVCEVLDKMRLGRIPVYTGIVKKMLDSFRIRKLTPKPEHKQQELPLENTALVEAAARRAAAIVRAERVRRLAASLAIELECESEDLLKLASPAARKELSL